jgi:hypothetical protein
VRQHDEIQVFHGDRAEHDLVAHDERPHEAGAILEADLDGPDVRHAPRRAVGEDHFALGQLFEPQPVADMLREAKVQRARIGQRINLQRKRRHTSVSQKNHPTDDDMTSSAARIPLRTAASSVGGYSGSV